MFKKILFFVWGILALTACEDVFEPAIENHRDLESMHDEPNFATGLLYNGYTRIPTNGWSFSEMATDDAVSNDEGNQYAQISTGQWASNFNPLNQWTNSRAAIQYMNIVLEEADDITFSDEPVPNAMFKERTKGEAYGLRALYMYYLLQAHGGMSGGELLGVPIVLQSEDADSEFNQPRATFEACMQQLYSDIDKAVELLPLDYQDISDESEIPDEYLEMGAKLDDYNRVFGNIMKLRFTERIALAIKSQAALLAASPAFSQGNSTTWEDAANFAADVIDLNGGIAGIDPNGTAWFANRSEIDGLGSGALLPEILWRTDVEGSSTGIEENNYPPSLYGNGLVNPTQNLVDAFPMANGYPIGDPLSSYDPANPYENRDPRLLQFIIVDGSTAGPNNEVISTSIDGGTNDGLNIVETSTRTGYYMRKLLREDVNLNPTSVNGQRHLKPRIRYTEIYLNYAEAANEAWGPTGTGGNAYSAYDVIKAIRERAGVGLSNGDAYLESVKNDKDAMRTLIRNERRLELSFEGFRFWDLRRWNADLSEPAWGTRIQGGLHETIKVQNRNFAEYMNYGPVPYSEVLKFSALQQNTGW